MEINKIIQTDCLSGLKLLPDNSVDCCVTSPPYYGLRDYGTEEQIGLEQTPELFVEKLVEVFTEVKRVLKPEGTLWLNLGDSYWGSGKAGNNPEYQNKHTIFGNPCSAEVMGKPTTGKHKDLKPKDLIGIPWMVAFALRQPYYTCNGCSAKTHALKWGKFPNGRLICPVCELSKGTEVRKRFLS